MKKVLIPTKLDSIAKELLEANGNYTVVQDAQTELNALAAQHADTYAPVSYTHLTLPTKRIV